jgi:hypothetical protein
MQMCCEIKLGPRVSTFAKPPIKRSANPEVAPSPIGSFGPVCLAIQACASAVQLVSYKLCKSAVYQCSESYRCTMLSYHAQRRASILHSAAVLIIIMHTTILCLIDSVVDSQQQHSLGITATRFTSMQRSPTVAYNELLSP